MTQDIPPFMTFAHDMGCVGINLIGMRRSGMNSQERSDARSYASKTLYRQGLGSGAAIEALEQSAETRSGAYDSGVPQVSVSSRAEFGADQAGRIQCQLHANSDSAASA